jgi:hypothetical protein
MRYLAVLAERPGAEVSALELVRATVGATRATSNQPSRYELLDRRALREYRARLAGLEDQLHQLEAHQDVERAALVRTERDWILQEVAASSGLSRTVRAFVDDGERARIAVTKAIRRAVNSVRAADPWLGELLATRVRTGRRCCLDPA